MQFELNKRSVAILFAIGIAVGFLGYHFGKYLAANL